MPMGEEEPMELEIKKESPSSKEERERVEEIVEKNLNRVIEILRAKDYGIIEPVKSIRQEVKEGLEEAPEVGERRGLETRVIGFAGKGGVGKTTLAALFIRAIGEEEGSPSILAMDSDPNTCLPEMLGSQDYETLGDMVEKYRGATLPIQKFRQEFASLLLRNEQEGYDLLPMGRSEDQGCYCMVNNLLRSSFRDEVLKGSYAYDYVVMDCEAGIEHISRKTSAIVSDLVIITDGSQLGMNTVRNIREVGRKVKIDIDNFYVVVNGVEDEEIIKDVKNLSDELKITFLGTVPYDDAVKKLSFRGGSVFELSEDSRAYSKVKEFVRTMLSRDQK
ncbi:hypothetical protein AKJ58_00875 [candidate division MSBL1 archaeon SCGC-AAA385D11]|uniref:CobQ/CobB/MinD/ParA nucleotide binding domain-containing protein n=1 Tax=candidate division MSBL1 archaeon SCGC-AAA385D11 TaxID=1698286 RepID=A0A133VNU3_9EURY|nr:hypothetical protein AKJ58_00875 [candidate division MSBL1 archaeon SCGC-AAA385D11]